MTKVKVGIIGTGNIGTDILMKVQRSDLLECGIFAGRNLKSKGMLLAQKMGVPISGDSIHAIENNPGCCEIVFDATSASVHQYHAPILKRLNKFTLDLTPSRIGKMCIPVLNREQCLMEQNINMVTCGGQATVPIIYALSQSVSKMDYVEIVATIASKSAGSGTRNNIDEFTQTTRDAIICFSKVEKAKAIIVLNPAEPPITMKNTIYALVRNPDMNLINKNIKEMERKIRKYVPGYNIIVDPVYENSRITITIEVLGAGDYLPSYAGNLDIITCASIEMAEEYAKKY